MATTLTENNLVLRYKVGVDEKGKDVFKQQSLRNISEAATDFNLLDLADLVGAVVEFPVSTIKKEQSFILTR
jgi:Protein of unknown function (DUF1659)